MRLPFNKWSKERIVQGRKFCTSRTRVYDDNRVDFVSPMPLWVVKNYLWRLEGADSSEEFERVWRSIFRGRFDEKRIVYVHFGDFREVE